MRFWHKSIDSIRDFLSEKGWTVTFVDLWGSESYSSDMSGISRYFDQSNEPLKDDAAFYVVVHPVGEAVAFDFKRAIGLVESGEMGDSFLLQQYPDGGLISFSRDVLPFQKDAQNASWWRIEDVELTTDKRRPWRPWPHFWPRK